MDIKEHTTPEKLERYAFLWSLAKLGVAALSLFFGATPFIYNIPVLMRFGSSLLPLSWLISGVAAGYLLYRWHKGGQKLFGGTDKKDKVLFFVLGVTGINLGLTAFGNNIGMSLLYGMPIADIVFKLTALVYLFTLYHLYTRWQASGEKLF